MELETREEGKILVVKTLGERIDAKEAVSFKETMAQFIEAGNRHIVLDISQVKFIDSSGLGAIVSTLKLLGRDGDIVISGTSDSIITMFQLTRMDRVFKMFATCEEGIQAINSA